MTIDYTSLLVALAFSGFAVLLAAFASWIYARKEPYLVLGGAGLTFLSIGVGLMALRNGQFNLVTIVGPFSMLLAGLSMVYSSVRLFAGKCSFWPPILVGSASIALLILTVATGYLGAGNFVLNAAGGLILALCGIEYIGMREEMRSATIANAVLYLATALTFFLCAGWVVASGEWVAYPVLDTWADNINAVMSLGGVSGIGTLTLVLHFARSARLHQSAANTDPLTGVLNRRALFERFPEHEPTPGLAVLVFDLDHFKQINDTLGHAAGDTSLQAFTRVLEAEVGNADAIARIGGEEFCIVMPSGSRQAARDAVKRIQRGLKLVAIPGGRPGTCLTVSIGMATGGIGEPFHSVLSRADNALYKAKRAGRDTLRADESTLAA